MLERLCFSRSMKNTADTRHTQCPVVAQSLLFHSWPQPNSVCPLAMNAYVAKDFAHRLRTTDFGILGVPLRTQKGW